MRGSSRGAVAPRARDTASSARGMASRWPVAVAAIAAPLCFTASFAVTSLWWLMPAALALFAWSAVAGRCRLVLYGCTLLGWLGAWGWLQWWMVDVTTAGYPVFVAYLALWPLLAALLLRRLATRGATARLSLAALLPIAWIGIEFARGEILFHGYPWYLAAHPLVEAPILAQGADLFGVPFVGTLVAVVAGAVADVVLAWQARRLDGGPSRDDARRRAGTAVALALAAIAGSLGYGAWRLAQVGDLHPGPEILAIQTNLPVSNKIAWAPEQQLRDYDGFVRQTVVAFRAALDQGRAPDLVAWPETMLPGFGLEPESIAVMRDGGYFPGDQFARGIVELASALRRPMVVGSPAFVGLRVVDRRLEWTRHFNSAYLVEPLPPDEGATDVFEGIEAALSRFDATAPRAIVRADKLFLTPFGETMPYISAWPWLERTLLSIGASGMSFDLDVGDEIVRIPIEHVEHVEHVEHGDGAASPRTEAAVAPFIVAAPICFEDTVSWLCRRMIFGEERATPGDAVGRTGKRADLFVNLSNDGWFGVSEQGRIQHAQNARWRCIENRVPMIRCVNTGVSVAIDSCGRLAGAVSAAGVGPGDGYGTPRIAGALLAAPALDERRTLLSRVGDVWGWAMLGLLVIATIATFRTERPPSDGS